MDYTKQLIKAINDLTKAVNKNTEAIKENTKPTKTVDESIKERIINKRIWNSYVNYNYKDLCDVSDREIDLYKRGMSVYNDNLGGKAYQPENGVLTTDGLGKTTKLNFGIGSVMYSGSWDSPKGIEIIPRDNDTYKSVIDKLNKLSGF